MVQYLVSDDPYHIEGLTRSHRVRYNVPVYADKVFRVQNAILILALRLAFAHSSCARTILTCPAVSTISVA